MALENPRNTKTEDHRVVTQPSGSLASDFTGEVKQEIEEIKATGDPVNPSQSDVLIQKHVTGLAVSFFVLIGLFLLLVIVGFFLYTRSHSH